MAKEIFISYSRKDFDKVKAIKDEIDREVGIELSCHKCFGFANMQTESFFLYFHTVFAAETNLLEIKNQIRYISDNSGYRLV